MLTVSCVLQQPRSLLLVHSGTWVSCLANKTLSAISMRDILPHGQKVKKDSFSMPPQRDDISSLLARQDAHVPRHAPKAKLGIQETGWLTGNRKFTCCAPKPARRKANFSAFARPKCRDFLCQKPVKLETWEICRAWNIARKKQTFSACISSFNPPNSCNSIRKTHKIGRRTDSKWQRRLGRAKCRSARDFYKPLKSPDTSVALHKHAKMAEYKLSTSLNSAW